MLIQLSVRNFALIDKIDIEFKNRLNVLSGETGAGKSIIIDAVSILLGARGQSDFIRYSKDKAIVEGTFIIPKKHLIEKKLEELGFEMDEDRILILTREITHNGKNICRINNRIVNLSNLKEIGSYLINIYGQHDFQTISNPQKQLDILDNLGEKKFNILLNETATAYKVWLNYKNEYSKMQEAAKNKIQRIDFLKFQIEEIDSLNIEENEDELIASELDVLDNFEKIFSVTTESYELLYGSNSAYDRVSKAANSLKSIENLDSQFKENVVNLGNISYQIEDCSRAIKAFCENINFDSNRKEYLQDRKYVLENIKRKYGGSLSEVLKYKVNATIELEELENSEIKIREIQLKKDEWEKKYLDLCEKLTEKRKVIASKFEKNISEELKVLAMPSTIFKVNIVDSDWKAKGKDKVEFLISTNPGEPLKPLAKIASGGEMSRIMLALKVIFANKEELLTLIFDEIDSGIGGHVLGKVAEKLFQISQFYQVICVTHSPQIACFGYEHFKISKNYKDGNTFTKVERLSEEDKVEELARMLGNYDQIAINHAQEMLNKAKEKYSMNK